MSEYTLLCINHSWLKWTAWLFLLAIVFTKHCWDSSQRLNTYALSFLHTTSSYNYTKLDVCIRLWCVPNDCPWLSNSSLTVILILLHSMTEHVLGPYWWGCTAGGLPCSWGSMTQLLYLIFSVMEIEMWFFCVWRTGQSFAQNTQRNRDYLEEPDIFESIVLKWIFEK